MWWSDPGAHPAYKVPSRDVVLVTDEVYGDALDPVTGQDHGCPWGWVRMIDISDPADPQRVGKFKPEPLPVVVTEDPALSLGIDKVVMWSFPVIEDGLIYALDLRNGLYILRYTGPGSDDIDAIEFLEGNSNLGDALRYEPVPDPEEESS
ncbi:MAG: hypothetical protein KY469_09230 [Actinobacteria bacterium]|nr:hypothetical protein [Actinomycetota bacterium]